MRILLVMTLVLVTSPVWAMGMMPRGKIQSKPANQPAVEAATQIKASTKVSAADVSKNIELKDQELEKADLSKDKPADAIKVKTVAPTAH